MKRIDEVIDFIKKNYSDLTDELFSNRNLAGDEMVTVYEKDGITIDYCNFWQYLEIFGLTEEEYNTVVDALGWDNHWVSPEEHKKLIHDKERVAKMREMGGILDPFLCMFADVWRN